MKKNLLKDYVILFQAFVGQRFLFFIFGSIHLIY